MKLNLLSTQPADGLTVVQFTAEPLDTLDYVTSVRALAQGLVRVTEVSPQGSVNHLRVENLSDHFAFFLDGDILVGAKQNRVLNTSLLLAPRSHAVVPVSCVERGRWHFIEPRFHLSPCAAPQSLRALKSQHLAACAFSPNTAPENNQINVWWHVAHLASVHQVHSPTDNLGDVFEANQARIEEALRTLQHNPAANGLAVWSGNRLLSVDIFNRPDALADYFHRLIRGIFLDLPPGSLPAATPAASADQLTAQIEAALATATPPHPGVAAGTERRFDTPDTVGFALEYQNHLVHLNLTAKIA